MLTYILIFFLIAAFSSSKVRSRQCPCRYLEFCEYHEIFIGHLSLFSNVYLPFDFFLDCCLFFWENEGPGSSRFSARVAKR